MTRWLITGASGMVGTDLCDALALRGEHAIALTRSDLDITDSRCVSAIFREAAPDVVVNCAAYTKVDLAESEESLANAINGSAVELVAQAANEVGALLVQISTDFVFDGRKGAPYEINDATNPLSVYGRSKLLGEYAATHAAKHVIVRTSWLFGVHGPNFVEAIRNQIRKGTNPLRVVNDQRGRPTYTAHLAEAVIRIVNNDARGIVHYADAEECTWFDFARAIASELNADVQIEPVATEDFRRPATRPAYSVLSTERYERLTGLACASWREGLREYVRQKAEGRRQR